MKLAVLGGSSPFTVALVDAFLPRVNELPRCELALHGRNADRLELVAEHARHRFRGVGWTVSTATAVEDVLRDADMVIHQVRYGGMELRRAGERLCQAVGSHADETLGPAALLTAIKLREPLARMSASIQTFAPRAAVINLTNPLSVATSWMHRHGVRNILGACELPLVTARQVALTLEIEPSLLEWSYSGLNHRGFLHGLRVDGECVLARLIDRLGDGDLAGVPAATIAELGAVPTKYFKLLTGLPDSQTPSRAEYLQRLQEDIVVELKTDARMLPSSLKRRYLDWYPHAVVPLVIALAAHAPRREIVNVVDADGISRERVAMVDRSGIRPIDAPAPSATVQKWLERFEVHERTVLAGLASPTRDWLHATIACDPLGGGATPEIADAVWGYLQSERNHVEL
jgi:6-phospho-beta-glucosidase